MYACFFLSNLNQVLSLVLIVTFVSLENLKILSIHISLFLLLFAMSVFAQQASLDGTKLVYKRFVTRSIDATSRGLGFTYRNTKFVQGKDRVFEIHVATIRDPKEASIQEKALLQGQGLKSYYYGKVNNAFAVRIGIGNQKAKFNREVPNAFEIKRGYSIGINAALLKPVYVEVSGADIASSGIKPYNPLDTTELVLGRTAFYHGLSKTKINPSLFLRYYWSFDFSKDDEKIKALEVGTFAEVYLNKLRIMAHDNNKRFFATLYVSYVFGNKQY
jgi:hypothetical protein